MKESLISKTTTPAESRRRLDDFIGNYRTNVEMMRLDSRVETDVYVSWDNEAQQLSENLGKAMNLLKDEEITFFERAIEQVYDLTDRFFKVLRTSLFSRHVHKYLDSLVDSERTKYIATLQSLYTSPPVLRTHAPANAQVFYFLGRSDVEIIVQMLHESLKLKSGNDRLDFLEKMRLKFEREEYLEDDLPEPLHNPDNYEKYDPNRIEWFEDGEGDSYFNGYKVCLEYNYANDSWRKIKTESWNSREFEYYEDPLIEEVPLGESDLKRIEEHKKKQELVDRYNQQVWEYQQKRDKYEARVAEFKRRSKEIRGSDEY